jgi:hypothetical protein
VPSYGPARGHDQNYCEELRARGRCNAEAAGALPYAIPRMWDGSREREAAVDQFFANDIENDSRLR